jgi:hypothetical protein
MDFDAAMTPPQPPDSNPEPIDFEAAMIPKKPGRPKKKLPPPDPPASIRPSNTYIDIDNMDDIDISVLGIDDKNIKSLIDTDKKEKLTNQELRFLAIYFGAPREKGKDRMTRDKAMIAAGYDNYSRDLRYRIARNIVKKYEQAVPDASKILRELGYGPVKTALAIIDHAENSPPTVSLNAVKLAAQVHKMIDQPDNSREGINIIINTAPAAPLPGTAVPTPDGPVQIVIAGADPGTAPPRKPLQITR